MKTLILCLLSFTAFGQNFVLQDGTKLYVPEEIWKNALHVNVSTPKEIQFAPGTQVKFIILEVPAGGKTIWIGDKVDKPTDPIPEPVKPIKFEAENPTSIVNAGIVGTIIGNMRGDLPGGVVIKYPAVEGRTKVRFRYSRGYPGNGTMIFKIGSTSNTLVFQTTGDWARYVEIEFNVSGSGVIEITSGEIGAANIDHFTML